MDRKAWIVIILCCLGLAVNLHYSRKNRESLVERERERQAEQAAKAKEEEKTQGEQQAQDGEQAEAANPAFASLVQPRAPASRVDASLTAWSRAPPLSPSIP